MSSKAFMIAVWVIFALVTGATLGFFLWGTSGVILMGAFSAGCAYLSTVKDPNEQEVEIDPS